MAEDGPTVPDGEEDVVPGEKNIIELSPHDILIIIMMIGEPTFGAILWLKVSLCCGQKCNRLESKQQ